MSIIPQLTDAGRGLLISALSGSTLNFTKIKIGNGEAPEEPRNGDYWYNTGESKLNKYSVRWDNSPRNITVGTTEPANPTDSDLWYNTNTSKLMYYGSGWTDSTDTITCSTTEPESPSVGDYWYDTANATLYVYGNKWNSVTGVTITAASTAPESPSAGDYWYDTTNTQLKVYKALWADTEGVNITVGAEPESPSVGDYWYDTANTTLKERNTAWAEQEGAVYSSSASEPESPSDNDYWYDTESAILKKYDGSEWQTVSGTFSESDTEPVSPTVGYHWYDTTNSKLKVFSASWATSSKTFTSAATAPSNASLADWWYDTVNSKLKVRQNGWDDDNSHTFNYGETAPATPSSGDWWYDTSLHAYGTGWNSSAKTFTYGSAAPTTHAIGCWWYDTANSKLKEWGKLFQEDTGDTFTYAATEPSRSYEDDLWYDTANSNLKVYTTGWVEETNKVFTYSSTAPATPSSGNWWYNTAQNQLYEYNGTQWVQDNTMFTCSASEPATQDAMTDLMNPMINISINEITQGTNYVSLTGVFDNSNVSSDFDWNETGVFAEDEDGNELLYAYCHTGDQYETIPANTTGKTISVTLTILVMVGDAESVTATIGEGALYATRESLENHKRDTNNPHGVTKEQLDLGNVQNLAPEDYEVAYSEAAALAEPVSGEKMSVFMGKVKKAIKTLTLHLTANNPHSITAAKINAAAASHKHSASDMTSGVLSVERGGTGASSLDELKTLVGSAPVFGWYTGDGTAKRKIELGFTPSAVFLCNARGMVGDDIDKTCGGLAVGTRGVRIRSCTAITHETTWSSGHTALLITTNGFWVSYSGECRTNNNGETYRYIAWR